MIATRFVCSHSFISTVKLLIQSGANINLQDKYGWTALMIACEYSPVSVIQMLIDAGADTNLQTRDAWTALMIVSPKENNTLTIEILLNVGANESTTNNDGLTASQIQNEVSSVCCVVM